MLYRLKLHKSVLDILDRIDPFLCNSFASLFEEPFIRGTKFACESTVDGKSLKSHINRFFGDYITPTHIKKHQIFHHREFSSLKHFK